MQREAKRKKKTEKNDQAIESMKWKKTEINTTIWEALRYTLNTEKLTYRKIVS